MPRSTATRRSGTLTSVPEDKMLPESAERAGESVERAGKRRRRRSDEGEKDASAAHSPATAATSSSTTEQSGVPLSSSPLAQQSVSASSSPLASGTHSKRRRRLGNTLAVDATAADIVSITIANPDQISSGPSQAASTTVNNSENGANLSDTGASSPSGSVGTAEGGAPPSENTEMLSQEVGSAATSVQSASSAGGEMDTVAGAGNDGAELQRGDGGAGQAVVTSREISVMRAKVDRLDALMKDTCRQLDVMRTPPKPTSHSATPGDPVRTPQHGDGDGGSQMSTPKMMLYGSPSAMANNFIKLNVGGEIFTTRRSTLSQYDGSYLAAIVSGRFDDERDENGYIFIDRDPKYFKQILNFLRDPRAPQTWDVSDPLLIHELQFFGIQEAIHPGTIYVAYGYDGSTRLSTIESYNFHTKEWKHVTEFKHLLSSPACAALNGKMYVTGGKNVKNHAVTTVSYFDPRSKDITLTTDLKVARFGHGLVELNGYLYAFGGYGDDGLRMSSVERYDEKTQSWDVVPALRTIRAALGCDALNGKIYVAGGYGKAGDGNNNQQALVKQVEVYDPDTEAWEQVADLLTPRAHVCCVSYQGCLWTVGGYNGTEASQKVEIYDPEKNQWTEGPSLLHRRSVVVCTVLGDRLFAIGGYDGQNYMRSTEVYDPVAKRWFEGPDMGVPRGRHCVCTLEF